MRRVRQYLFMKKPEQILIHNKKAFQGALLKSFLIFWFNLLLIGGPWRNRTFNLLIKSQVLCLVELTAQWDPCKTPPFAQFRRQAQILSLEILNVFLHLKFSPSLNLNKIERFSKVSVRLLNLNPAYSGKHFLKVSFINDWKQKIF